MQYNLSSHAQKRLLQRKIQNKWLEVAFDNYIRSIVDEYDNNLIHIYYPVPEKGYKVLHVIYNEETIPFTIVTAFFENEVIKP